MPAASARRRTSAIVASVASAAVVLVALAALGVTVQRSDVGAGAAPTSSVSASDALRSGTPTSPPALGPVVPTASPASSDQPSQEQSGPRTISNVVLLLADDLDWALFDQVPRLNALRQRGTSLTNFVVTESLCCPSRSSITLGQYVHNHRVESNIPPTGGGWETFYRLGHQEDCLPTWLTDAGVATAHVGKYLNGFPGRYLPPTYVPPGWSHFVSTVREGGSPYDGYDYELTNDRIITKHGFGTTNFLDDVLTADALSWLSSASTPFYLELDSYLPHTPAPAAPRNAGTHAGATVKRTPSFNVRGANEPNWLRALPLLGPKKIASLDQLWAKRLDSAEGLADSIDAVLGQLVDSGHADDTLVIITSDNGYHVGAHRLLSGKHTPYREDSVVPAVLIGPGIPAGQSIQAMTSTIDLAPTIATIMGAATPTWADGRDLMPLVQDPTGASWRTGVLTENLTATRPGDPDYTGFEAPQYRALRTEDWLYASYGKRGSTLYDLRTDPYEIDNVLGSTAPAVVKALRAQLAALSTCSGPTCRVADSMSVPVIPSAEASPSG